VEKKMKTEKKDFTRELKTLRNRIEKVRRNAGLETDSELAEVYKQDVLDLERILNAVKARQFRNAAMMAYDLDTAVRDEIPCRLYNFIGSLTVGPATERTIPSKGMLESAVKDLVKASSRPRVLVEISGGVATVSCDSGARVAVVDYDNEPKAKVPKDFQNLEASR
jgi:hypothetical protein